MPRVILLGPSWIALSLLMAIEVAMVSLESILVYKTEQGIVDILAIGISSFLSQMGIGEDIEMWMRVESIFPCQTNKMLIVY